MANMLLYNPASSQAGSLLQRRPMSAAQQNDMLSRALMEQKEKDPLYKAAMDRKAYEPAPRAGAIGELAKHFAVYEGEQDMKALDQKYQDRQAQQNQMYSQILSGGEGGQSALDGMPPQQREIISRVLQSGDSDMIQAVVGQVVKQSFEPGMKTKVEYIDGPDGKYAVDPSKPDAPPRKVLGAVPKDERTSDQKDYEFARKQALEADPNAQFPGFTDWAQGMKRSGATNNVTKMETEWDKAIGGEMAKGYIEQQNRGRAADSTIGQIGRFRTVMANTKMGPVAGATLPVRSALNELGITDDQNVPNQEELTAMSNRFALDVVGNMKGPSSDKDMVFAKDTVVSLSKSNPGNTAILDVAERVARRDQQYAQWQDEYRKANNGRLDPNVNEYIRQKSEENPMFTPQERQQLAAAKGGKDGATSTPPDVIYRGSRPK